MKIMRSSELLSDSEIIDLLNNPQRMNKLSKIEELTEMARVVLKESLEKTMEIYKENKDFGSVESFNNLLCNFESLRFFIEFESITESGIHFER